MNDRTTRGGAAAERKARLQLRAMRVFQAYMPLPLAERLMKPAVARAPLPAGVTREAVSAAGVACEWLIPAECRQDVVLLYLHGGGFVFGMSPQHVTMVAGLAQRMGARALLVDYRLAPRHPFPAALDDCVTAFRWLLARGVPAANVVVAGDSAGGNLTLVTMMKLRDAGGPLPAAAACLSPVGRLLGPNASRVGRDPLLHPRAIKMYDRAYLAGNDPANPLVSPVLGDWHGLPPLLIHAGQDEVLRVDAVRMEESARAAGVDVRLEIYPRMWHVWQLFADMPQATESLSDIAQFLRRHCR